MRVDNAQPFLIASHVASSAGIDEIRRTKGLWLVVGRGRFDAHAIGIRGKFPHRPSLAHIGAAITGVLQQQMVKARALNVDRLRLSIKPASAENKTGTK